MDKSKEEIFKDLKDAYEETTPTWLRNYDSLFIKVIIPAMQQYADQEAIGFGEWATKNNWWGEEGFWYDKPFTGEGQQLTTQQLYAIYQQSKQ